MSQLGLFDAPRSAPVQRPSNPAFVRKHLLHELNKARAAIQLPWSAAEANDWAERFPRLAQVLPAEEAKELTDAFSAELARLSFK